MALDPSIALQVQSPNPGTMISQFLDIGQKGLDLQKSQALLQPQIAQGIAQSQTAQSQAVTAQQQAEQAQLETIRQHAANALQSALAMRDQPNLQPEDLAQQITQYGQKSGASPQAISMAVDGLPKNTGDPVADHKAAQGWLTQRALAAQTLLEQINAKTPQTSFVQTNEGTLPVNTRPYAPAVPGAAPGVGPMAPAMTPPNQLVTDASGGTQIANPATRTVQPLAPAGPVAAPPMTFPPGETRDTQAQLQGERTAAQQAMSMAPQLHDINRSIMSEVDKGITTGTLGQLKQKLASATGFNLGGETGTDYNVLGKMLERSALQAAQGMGPHTNAGLEAQVRANGSVDYTPAAIRKIAGLNDAIVTGSTLYQSGLENAIKSSPNGVFAKRGFDQAWSSALSPTDGVNGIQALRFKNAVENGDTKGKLEVLSEVGGLGSKGARVLGQKYLQLMQLSGQPVQ